MTIFVSSIVTAFQDSTIGTKVRKDSFIQFIQELNNVINTHDFSLDKIPGQGYIHIPNAIPYIIGGMGKHRDNSNDYVLRAHRGKVHAYLKREFAEPVTDCHVVVYTRDAYLNDPDIEEDPVDAEDIRSNTFYTHVLVAVLASSSVKSTLSPYRFVKNLAGGNHEALAWTADEIRAKAKEIAENVDGWGIVAD